MISVSHIPTPEIDRENPWPGLSSFTEESCTLFFGRDKETDELARLVRRETLTVLFGQSGLGKSSLLQAGLFPLLREQDHLPLYIRLDHGAKQLPIADCQVPIAGTADERPSRCDHESIGNRQSPIGNFLSDQVKAALNAAFVAARADAPAIGAGETLWEYFHRKDVDIWSAKNRLLTPVLAFDQFEEIFTLGRADEAARERSRAFLIEIADLIENRPPAALREKFDRGEADPARYNYDKPSCRVILSLREDFLPDLEGLKQSLPALIHNRLRLKRLNGAQALEAVTRPAPHLLAEGVGEKIVEFVAGVRGGSVERLLEMEVEPALLSVICRELNERRRALGQEKITADLVSGNRREILTDFYERSVSDMPEGMRIFIEDHLLTKSGFRDNLALETALEFPGVTRLLIDTLVSRRLLRIEERLGVQRVELTHDVLADVVKASRDARQQRLALEAAAARESAAREEAARRAHRMRFAIAGLVAVVMALSIGAVFGIRSQRQTVKRASHTDFVLGSRLLDEGKLTEGLAYLVRAGRKDPHNPIVAPRLLATLAAENFCLPNAEPIPLNGPAIAAAYSAEGRWLAVQNQDDVIRIFDAVTWTTSHEIKFGHKIRRLGWQWAGKTPDLFAVLLEDNTVVVCDAASGRPKHAPIRVPEPIPGRIPNLAVSPDGRWIAASSPAVARVWDVASGRLTATMPNDRSAYSRINFSADSQRVVTTHGANVTQMWSVADGAPVGEPMVRSGTTTYLNSIFSEDGSTLVVWHVQGAQRFDSRTGLPLSEVVPFSVNTVRQVEDVALNADGRRLAMATLQNEVAIIDLESGKNVVPPLQHGGPIYHLAFGSGGSVLFTNSVDGVFRLWDVATGRLIAVPTFQQEQYSPAALSPDRASVAVFAPDGHGYRLRIGRGRAEPIRFPRARDVRVVNFHPSPPTRLAWGLPDRLMAFDVASGKETSGGFPFPGRIVGPSGAIRSTHGQTLGDGQSLVVLAATPSGRAWRAWSLGDHNVAQDVALSNVPEDVPYFMLNPTGKLGWAIGGGQTAAECGIWDLGTGQRIARLVAGKPIRRGAAQVSPNETLAWLQTTDNAVHVYKIASAKRLATLSLSGRAVIETIRFSPDSRHVLAGDDWGGVHVFNAHTGEKVKSTLAHRTLVRRFDASSDGRYYASLSADGSAQVWETATHAAVGAPMLHFGNSSRVDFSRDNTRVIASGGMRARVWDVGTGLPLSPALESPESIGVVGYSPDGRFVEAHAGVGGTSGILVWSAPPKASGAATPDWLLDLATVCAGQRLDDENRLVPAAAEFARFGGTRRTIAALPAADPYGEWAQWLLSDRPTRPIAPHFQITPAESRTLREKMSAEIEESLPALVARVLQMRGARPEEAEPLERRILELTRTEYGEEGEEFAQRGANLAVTLVRVGKHAEAESLTRQVLRLREKIAANAIQIANMKAALGWALAGLARHMEAEPLLLAGYDVLKDSTLRPRIRETAQALADLYEATERPDQAAEWKRKAQGEAAVSRTNANAP
ncbi:MAG: hypothetical protein Q7S40_04115 [Opitutaceae bacterium]|nr:hypothetical protein [Opitutaceae bacterium]